MKNFKKYFPMILLIVGQVFAVWSIIQEVSPSMWIGMILSGIGAAFWAKKTGRSVLAWFCLSAFVPLIGPIITFAVMLLPEGRKSEGKQRSIYLHIIVASILFLLGPVILNSTVFVMIGFVLAVASVAKGLKYRSARKETLGTIGIYLLMLVSAIVLKSVNNHVSYQNAGSIIAAADQYMKKTGSYPDKLGNLIPNFLTEIPRARYTLYGGEFKYNCRRAPAEEQACRLMFVEESPFARNVYDFKSRSWHSVD
ncbi:MAG TPA: hypothetical protein VHO84_12805 [Syntrophorhabdaceae bacterium]|nr:hypothetical protein [Syntrophorhabdaceae bacterium]